MNLSKSFPVLAVVALLAFASGCAESSNLGGGPVVAGPVSAHAFADTSRRDIDTSKHELEAPREHREMGSSSSASRIERMPVRVGAGTNCPRWRQ